MKVEFYNALNGLWVKATNIVRRASIELKSGSTPERPKLPSNLSYDSQISYIEYEIDIDSQTYQDLIEQHRT